MRILFVLSVLLFIYSFIRIKKKDTKLNIILWLILSIIIFMCFNSVSVFILSLFNISATLLIRSIINIILSFCLIIFCKKKQSYYFDKFDLISVIILFALCVLICYFRFGFDLKCDFEINDAAFHYSVSELFYKNSTLIGNIDYANILHSSYKGSPSMFISYTNMGTLFQLGDIIVGNTLYKLYIIFELFMLFIGGLIFYFCIKRKQINLFNYLLIISLTILYVMGYPVNSMMYGFQYWSLVIILISSFILVIKENISNKYLYFAICFLLSLCIFFCYYLFIPCIYLGIGLYYLYLLLIKKSISFNEGSLSIFIILLIPFIIGIIYFILPNYIGSNGISESSSISNIFNMEGNCYKYFIGDFIFLLPIIIWYIYDSIKNKKIDVDIFLYLTLIIYMIIMLILCLNSKCSTYYYYKLYNLLWFLSLIIIGNTLLSKNSLIKIYYFIYLIIIFVGCFGLEEKLNDKREYLDVLPITNYLSNIYRTNIDYFMQEDYIIDEDTLILFDYVKNNYDILKNNNGEIPFFTDFQQKEWIIYLTEITPINKYVNRNDLLDVSVSRILDDDNSKYFVLMNRSLYKIYIDINNYDVIYENSSGYVLKKVSNN